MDEEDPDHRRHRRHPHRRLWHHRRDPVFGGRMGKQLTYARTLLGGDRRYRRYVIMRALLSMIRVGSPFYVVCALDRLDAPASIAGTYLSMLTLTRILSNPLWGRILRRRGLKFVLQSANLLLASSAFLAVGLPAMIGALGLADAVAAYAFGAVLLVQGLALGAHNVSLLPTLYEIAPARERASYIGLLNTVMGPTSFVSIVWGSLIDALGFEPMFLAAGVLVFGGFLVGAGLRLPEAGGAAAD